MATLKGLGTLAKDVGTRAKKNAIRGIGNAMFGTGVVGGALNKAFQKKFSEGGEEDTRVADALEAQSNIQDNNSAILTRIETIVMNIADNVYNLAGIMNANVVSMKEAQRLQQERAFKEAAAAEESGNEKSSEKVGGAGIASGEPTTKKGGILETLKGFASNIGSTRNLMKGFLKKFGVMAVGLTAALGTAAYMGWGDSKDGGGGAPPPTEEGGGADEMVDVGGIMMPKSQIAAASETPTTSTSGGQATPVSSAATTSASGVTPDSAVAAKAPILGVMRGVPIEAPLTAAETASTSNVTLPPTPVTPPPPPPIPVSSPTPSATPSPSSAPPPELSPNASLAELEERKTTIKKALYATKALIRTAEKQGDQGKVEENKQYLKNVLEPGLAATEKLIARASPTNGSTQETSSSSSGARLSGSPPTSNIPSAPKPRPMASSPSTGASVGDASTAVAAASEPTKKSPSVQSFDTTTDSSRPMTLAIPTPVAGRGSLDVGIEFHVGG